MTSSLSPTNARSAKPRASGGLPLLGHALAFGRDPDGFVARSHAAHGDVFRVRFPGGERTFLLDPFDYPAIFAEERLRFLESAAEIAGRAFGYEPKLAIRPEMHEFSSLTGRDMRGDALQTMSERMQRGFVARMGAAIGKTPREHGLLALLSEHFFAAGIEAIFGDGFYSKDLYADYERLDRYLAPVVAGVPPFLLPGLVRARTRLAEASMRRDSNHALVLDSRTEFYDRLDLPRGLRGAFDAGLLWASQANTVVTAFWTVVYLLRDARALDAVRNELREVTGVTNDPRDAALLSRDALRRLVLLDSACSEAMRLTIGNMNGRRASEAFEMQLDSGATIAIDEGEEILLYPRKTHFDPEIFEDPSSFRFDRFVDERGRSAQFSKRGRRLTMAFLPFGGGVSMCPGRFFARNEIKVLVATMMGWMTTELVSREVPPLDFSRIGLGALPPKHDVTVRIAMRS